jgi:transposase
MHIVVVRSGERIRLLPYAAGASALTWPQPKRRNQRKRHLRELSGRLLGKWDALWTFSQVEGIEPMNNSAERALRPAVVWCGTCFGTQSAEGSRFVERSLSVRATCAQQDRELFAFLVEALRAAWADAPAPALLPTP